MNRKFIPFAITAVVISLLFSCKKQHYKFYTINKAQTIVLDKNNSQSPKDDIKVNMQFAESVDEEHKVAAENINSSLLGKFFASQGKPEDVIREFIDNSAESYRSISYPLYIEQTEMYEGEFLKEMLASFENYYKIDGKFIPSPEGTIAYEAEEQIYTGGAHPVNFTYYINFDKETGLRINLDDVFKDESRQQLNDLLLKMLMQQQKAKSIEDLNELGYLVEDDMSASENFLLKDDSIVFMYNVYDIAPYSMGPTRIAINYTEISEMMTRR